MVQPRSVLLGGVSAGGWTVGLTGEGWCSCPKASGLPCLARRQLLPSFLKKARGPMGFASHPPRPSSVCMLLAGAVLVVGTACGNSSLSGPL